MTEVLQVNDKPASRINAEVKHETEKATLLDCEGDEHWFPNSSIEVENDGTVLIQEWIYNQKFPE